MAGVDYLGAKKAGMKSILVRTPAVQGELQADTLTGV